MSLVTIILVLIVIGVVLGLINTYIPMAPSIKTILNAVVINLCFIMALISFWYYWAYRTYW